MFRFYMFRLTEEGGEVDGDLFCFLSVAFVVVVLVMWLVLRFVFFGMCF